MPQPVGAQSAGYSDHRWEEGARTRLILGNQLSATRQDSSAGCLDLFAEAAIIELQARSATNSASTTMLSIGWPDSSIRRRNPLKALAFGRERWIGSFVVSKSFPITLRRSCSVLGPLRSATAYWWPKTSGSPKASPRPIRLHWRAIEKALERLSDEPVRRYKRRCYSVGSGGKSSA